MPRQKSTDQIETLEQKQRELSAKLRKAKADARAAEQEKHREKAQAAGLILLAELDANPTGPLAVAFRAVADMKATRRKDRAALGLGEGDQKHGGQSGKA